MATRLAKKMITGKAAIAKVLASGLVVARAEQEFGALGGVAEQVGDAVRTSDWIPARPQLVHSTSQAIDRLQREGGADDAQADRLAVGRQQERDGQDRKDPGDAHQVLIQ